MTTTHYDETETTTNLHAGTYGARCTAWSWDTTKNGDPCLALLFELTAGKPGYALDGRLYFDTDKEDSKGRTAADRSLEALHAMGFEGDLGSLDMLDADPDCIKAGTVDLVVEINEKGYPRVKFVNAPRSARELRVFAEPDAQTKGGFFAKMRARGAALAAKTAATGTRPMMAQSRDAAASRAASQNTRPAPAQAAAARPATPQKQSAPARGPGLGAPDERFRDEYRAPEEDEIPF